MRSLAAIFPGFLPPLAVINATDPLPPERETTTEGGKRDRKREGRRERERESMREGNSPTHGAKAALAEAIASEGVIPLSVFVNFVSCISRHYSPQRAFLRTLRAR